MNMNDLELTNIGKYSITKKDVTKEFKKKGDPIYEYGIRSFYGVLSADREVKDPVYVSFRTKAHDKFGQAMSRGDHGSLD